MLVAKGTVAGEGARNSPQFGVVATAFAADCIASERRPILIGGIDRPPAISAARGREGRQHGRDDREEQTPGSGHLFYRP